MTVGYVSAYIEKAVTQGIWNFFCCCYRYDFFKQRPT